MNNNIKIIILIVAAIWHIGITVILRIKNTDQPKITFKELLRLAESDLLKHLDRKLEELSEEERQKVPYKKWSEKIRFLKKEMKRRED